MSDGELGASPSAPYRLRESRGGGRERMGAFYNSICVPGNARQQVRESLLRWLSVKGFELSRKPMLFDLDGESERCAFLVSNERWTLLFFSKYEEERRLIRELQNWADVLLYLWVQDSDVWGYDLFDPNGFAGTFNSDPRSYRSFADDDLNGGRPPADPEDVCRRLGLDGHAADLHRIHRHRSSFKEDACWELCRLIGAEPALTSYDDLERGAIESLDGWRIEQLPFVRQDAASAHDKVIDLHELSLLGQGGEGSLPDRSDGIEIPPEVLEVMERRRRRVRFTVFLLRPLSWLARWTRRATIAPRPSRQPPTELPKLEDGTVSLRQDSSDIIEVRHLINERHRCRIRLAVGGEIYSGSSKPASVFAFQFGDTSVTCTARPRSRIEDVLQQPSRSRILRDEKFLIGGLKARHVVFELPPKYLAGTTGSSFLGLHVVQTEAALYVFLYRFPERINKEVERAIRSTVSSFRLLS